MRDPRGANLLGALALALTDAMQRDMARISPQGDSGNAALVVIASLSGLSIDRLAKILRLSQPGTVRLVDRLQDEGLVERRPGADRRTLALFLTEAGQRQRRALLLGRERSLNQALDLLSSAEREVLVAAAEKILPRLSRNDLEAETICRFCDEEACPVDRCPFEFCEALGPGLSSS